MPLRLGLPATGRAAFRLFFSASVFALGLTACGDAEHGVTTDDGGLDASDASDASEVTPNFTLRFRAKAGEADAVCGVPLAGFGVEGDREAKLLDLRFYVHGVELRNAEGEFVPVEIVDEAPWQTLGVALLDFEDASGACSNGTADTRDFVSGVVPEGEYDAVRFTVGVPFDLNHMDVTVAPSPLNLTRLYWNWRGGYVFLRTDLQTVPVGEEAAAGFQVHVGSTGCTSADMTTAPDEECLNPNRPTITLEGFDAASSVVVLDVAAMVEGVDLAYNTPDTGLGCMSAPNDPECAVPMTRLGLPFGEAPPAMTAFRLETE